MIILALASILVMAGVAYIYYYEGLVASFAAAFTSLISSMVAFHVWPYLAGELEPAMQGTFLDGCEDALVLTGVFAAVFALMRLATVHVVSTELEYSNAVNRAGAVIFGLVTGYIVAGFLFCVVQTLPLHQQFLGFQPPANSGFESRFLPPDQNVLRLMDRSTRGAFAARVVTPDEITVFQTFTYDFANTGRRYNENPPAPEQPPAPPPKKEPKKDVKKPNPKVVPKPKEKKEEIKEKKNDDGTETIKG